MVAMTADYLAATMAGNWVGEKVAPMVEKTVHYSVDERVASMDLQLVAMTADYLAVMMVDLLVDEKVAPMALMLVAKMVD